jgi:hypothetical protein
MIIQKVTDIILELFNHKLKTFERLDVNRIDTGKGSTASISKL